VVPHGQAEGGGGDPRGVLPRGLLPLQGSGQYMYSMYFTHQSKIDF
jgi:hypothetical protein